MPSIAVKLTPAKLTRQFDAGAIVAAAAGRRARRPIGSCSVPSAPTVPPPRAAPLLSPTHPPHSRRGGARDGRERDLNRWDFSTLALRHAEKYFYKTNGGSKKRYRKRKKETARAIHARRDAAKARKRRDG